MIRKIRGAEDLGRGIVAESERRFIYARRENLPTRTRIEIPVRTESRKTRGSRRTG